MSDEREGKEREEGERGPARELAGLVLGLSGWAGSGWLAGFSFFFDNKNSFPFSFSVFKTANENSPKLFVEIYKNTFQRAFQIYNILALVLPSNKIKTFENMVKVT